MTMLAHRSLFLSLGLAAATAFAAPKPVVNPAVGVWNGHLVNVSIVPPTTSSKQKPDPKAISNGVELLKAISIKLTVKKDGSYTAVTSLKGKSQSPSFGKWKLKGKSITLTPNSSASQHEYGTIAKNGKSITFTLPQTLIQQGVHGHAEFVKAKS